MTIDSGIRDRLHAAVDDTTAPAAFAQTVMKRGRARRRRRAAVAGVLAAAALAGGALLAPILGQPTGPPSIANGGAVADPVAVEWAGSLPEGADPALPYFAYGKLWSEGRSVTLPASVNATVGPWAVEGGWIVMLGQSERDLAWALLSSDGGLRNLPAETYENGLGMARFEVSPDGRQAATEKWLVDVVAMTASELPHAPAGRNEDGHVTEVRPKGFTEQGLVYEAAPYSEGMGTTYLLRSSGSTVRVDLPDATHIPDNSPGDIAVGFDHADPTDTCITSHRLVGTQWVEDGNGCVGKPLGEAGSISPDGRWLVTDDLPLVWDLQAGDFVGVDLPRRVVTSRGDALVGGVVWETDDSFLISVADRTTGEGEASADFDQFVHVVRCRMSTGACELADFVENRVVAEVMASTEFRFATS